MERHVTDVKTAKQIFQNDFIGLEEILNVSQKSKIIPGNKVPLLIPYSERKLKELKEQDYFLILGISHTNFNEQITLELMRSLWGFDPSNSEPCFYNQDWFLNEAFFSKQCVSDKWYIIKKTLIPESRGKLILKNNTSYRNPFACECAYAFFMYYFNNNVAIWPNEYVWCQDKDLNGDQIYVGRYYDKNGVNKNGFSIHRHLSINSNYGSIDLQ